MTIALHPAIDNGINPGSGTFTGGTLVCHCADHPVKAEIKGDALHNHACGCAEIKRHPNVGLSHRHWCAASNIESDKQYRSSPSRQGADRM